MFEFKLPDLGEGVHEGQIVSVLVKEGDPIEEYAPMLEVETDKAAVEIPSPKSGTISKVLCEAGQLVKVGEVLIVIDESGNGAAAAPAREEKPAAKQQAAAQDNANRGNAQAAVAEQRPAPAQPSRPAAPASPQPAAPVNRTGPVPAAPAIRKLARELGVDINTVPGSGPNGRIVRDDVVRFSRGETAAAPSRGGDLGTIGDGAPLNFPTGEMPDFAQYGPIRRVQPPQIRKAIARQMTRAWLNVPRVTHGDTADMTDIEEARKAYNASVGEGGAKLTTTAIIMKVVALGLKRYPQLNASWDARTEEIIYKDYVHIGCAVDTPRGLIVPVIRDVDVKPLAQVAGELTDLANRIRKGQFDIAELRGATFTVTNVGALGGSFVTAMVNFPECGILGLGRSQWQPTVKMPEKEIVARLMMPVSLSFDHRLVDGADAARFTRDIISALQSPLGLLSLS